VQLFGDSSKLARRVREAVKQNDRSLRALSVCQNDRFAAGRRDGVGELQSADALHRRGVATGGVRLRA